MDIGLDEAAPVFDPLDPMQDPPPHQRTPAPSLPALPGESPAEDVFQRNIREQRARADQQMVEAFNAAMQHDPGKAREAARLAAKLGLAADVVERKLPEVRAILAAQELEDANLAARSPALAQKLRDPVFFAQARDDWKNLSLYQEAAYGAEVGRLQAERGRIGARLASFGGGDAEWRRLAEIRTRLGQLPPSRGIVANAAEFLGQMEGTLTESLAAGIAAATPVAIAGQTGPQVALPEEVITVPIAFAIGAGTVGLGRAAQIEGGNTYVDLVLEHKVSPGVARLAALGVGTVNAALEAVGVGFATKPVRDVMRKVMREELSEALVRPTIGRAAGKAAVAYVRTIGGETGTEVLQEVSNIVAEGLAAGEWDGAGRRLVDVAVKTAQGMVLLGIPGAGLQFAHEASRAAEARQSAQVFQRMQDAAALSRLAKEAPEAFAEFAAEAAKGTGAETVYIDATQFDAVLRQGGKPAPDGDAAAGAAPPADLSADLDRVLPGMAAQVRAAAARGEDVAMPSGEFLAKLSGTAVGKALTPHVRFDPEAMSLFDAQQATALAKENAAAVEEQAGRIEDTDKQLRAIEKQVAEQLVATGRFGKRDAAANAKWWGAFVRTLADRLGVAPAELQAMFPLTVRRAEVAPDAGGAPRQAPADAGSGRQPAADVDGRPQGGTPGPAGSGTPDVPPGDAGSPGTLAQRGAAAGAMQGGFRLVDGKPLIVLTEESDASTFVHEVAHAFLSIYADLAAQKAHPLLLDDFRAFLRWAGVESVEAWQGMSLEQQRRHHEAFAASFELYVFEGKAPAPGLQRLFDRFAAFLRSVYRAIIGGTLNAAHLREFGADLPPLTDDIRAVMDRMLASEEAVAATHAIRGAVPAFQTWEQAKAHGMSPEQWTKHLERQRAAEDAAIGVAAQASVGAMRWLSGAKAKRLRELQRAERETREGLRGEVAAAVQEQPIYHALRWLRKGEYLNANGKWQHDPTKHKLNRNAVRDLLGLEVLRESTDVDAAEPAAQPSKRRRGKSMVTRIRELGGITRESWDKSYPGERRGEFRIKGVVRAKGGIPWDHMAQSLREEGYAPQDSDPSDTSWIVDALEDAANGFARYSWHEDAAQQQFDEPDTRAPETPEERIERIAREDEAAKERAAMRFAGAPVQTRSPTRAIERLRGVLAEDGLEPDFIAQMFGFQTGEQLVREILSTKPIEQAIETALDARMLAEHSELADPRRRDAAIEAALHTEARRRFVAAELKALGRSFEPVRVMLAAAKEAARIAIGQQKVGQLTPRRFAVAARRASVEAFRALRAGDVEGAIAWKRRQMLQEALYDAATPTRQALDRSVAAFRQFGGRDKDIAKSRDIDLVYAGQALAAVYGLGPKIPDGQRADLVRRGLEKVKAEHPGLAARLAPLLAREATPYGELTVDEFREVAETGAELWATARAVRMLNAEGKQIDAEAAAGELTRQLGSLPPPVITGRGPDGRSPSPWRRRIADGLGVLAGLRIWEHTARALDGGRPDGPWQRYTVAPMMRAVTRLRDHRATLVRRLVGSMQEAEARSGSLWTAGIRAPELAGPGRAVPVFRGKLELLGALLHAGTTSNLQANLVARGWGDVVEGPDGEATLDSSRWDAFVDRMFREGLLNAADTQFLQTWWDTFAELLPQAQKAHKALYGFEFATIEHRPMATPFGTLKGGYVPKRASRYEADPRMFARDDELMAGEGFRFSVGTGKGFTLSRDETYRPPLTHNVGELLGNVDQELRFVHLQPVVADVMKLLRSSSEQTDAQGNVARVRLQDALTSYDRELLNGVLVPHLRNASLQRTSIPGKHRLTDAASRFLASSASLVMLGLNLSNSLLQAGGILNARAFVRGQHLRAAVWRVFTSPARAYREMVDASRYMAQVYNQDVAQLQQYAARASLGPLGAGVSAFRDTMSRWSRLPQIGFQFLANAVTWHGARAQALADGMDAAAAVESADQAVRLAQGSGNPESLADFQVATPWAKLWLQFGTYANTVLNGLLGSRGRAASTLTFLVLLPAVWETAAKSAVRGLRDEDDDGDEDLQDLAITYGKTVGRNVIGMVPVAGPLVAAMAASDGMRVVESPGASAMREAWRGVSSLLDAAFTDAEQTEAQQRAILTAITVITGIPLAAPVRTAQQLGSDR